MIVFAGLLYYFIPKGFFPLQDTGIIQAVTQTPEATSFDAMSEREQTVARLLLEDPAVESISSFIGVDATNTTPNTGRMQINLKALSTRGVSATKVIERLRPKLSRLTGIKTYLQPVQDLTVEDRVSRTQYQYTIQSSDSAELKMWSTKLLAKLSTLPQLDDVTTDELPNGNAITVDVDRVTASRLGINPQSLDNTLYDAFGQRQITTLYTQTNQYHVILEADSKFQTGVDRLSDIYLQGSGTTSSSSSSGGGSSQDGTSSSSSTNSQLTASSTSGVSATTSSSSTLATTSANTQLSSSVQSGALSGSTTNSTVLQTSATSGSTTSLSTSSTSGGSSTIAQSSTSGNGGSSTGTGASSSSSYRDPIPLAAFTKITKSLTPLTINRQSQFPVITISFNLANGVHLSQAVDAVNKAASELKMPTTVQTSFQGTAASYETSLTNEGLLVLAALLTVYIVLGVLYESFIHPFTILSTLPSAGVGALLALMLFRMDLGIVGIIGIVLLIGIVKKNGIMMVDFALNAERVDGKGPEEAIYNASLLRFRPIMMTTLAALFGGLPLALGRGIGSELRRPLGIAMVGGLLLSQALTLYTTPVIYLWFDGISRKLQGRKKDQPAIPPGASLEGRA